MPANAAAPVFAEGPELNSDAGHVLLGWEAQGPVTLSIARRADFADARPLYRGEAGSYFLSGLADGRYYLRLADDSGERSSTLALVVAHQSLARALWLTLLGLVITIGIVAVILRGARDD